MLGRDHQRGGADAEGGGDWEMARAMEPVGGGPLAGVRLDDERVIAGLAGLTERARNWTRDGRRGYRR